MANCYSVSGKWQLLLVFLAAMAPVTSQERTFDPTLPTLELTFNIPKSTLVQIVWKLRNSGQTITDFEVRIRDPFLREFACENDNYNDGLCTVSGLAEMTTYNVTVSACADNRCGLPAVAYITTPTDTRIFFGSIFTIFIVIVVLGCIALNLDLCYELLQPLYMKLKAKVSGRNYIPGQSSQADSSQGDSEMQESLPTTSDIPLTSVNQRHCYENIDAINDGPSSPRE